MKNALNNQVGMLGDMFLWLVANLKQGVIYFIKQACGNDILASVYLVTFQAIVYRQLSCSFHGQLPGSIWKSSDSFHTFLRHSSGSTVQWASCGQTE